MAVTSAGAALDGLFNTYLYAGIVVVGLVMLLFTYLMIRYRGGVEPEDAPTPGVVPTLDRGNTKLAIVIWIALFLLFIPISFATYDTVMLIEEPPANSDGIVVEVTGERYTWHFEYPNGRVSTGRLVVPKGQPVTLEVGSSDVMHNLWIPDFKVMADAIPGQTNEIWFEALQTGSYAAYCNEFCGDAHSFMTAEVVVMNQSGFQDWYAEEGGEMELSGAAAEGQELISRFGCSGCHSSGEQPLTGPGFGGLYVSTETLADGSEVEVDEDYLREAIVQPDASVVKGFPAGVMPDTFGEEMNEDEVDAVIEYIKTLGKTEGE